MPQKCLLLYAMSILWLPMCLTDVPYALWLGELEGTLSLAGEVQGRGGEDELGTELHSQEFPISKPAVKPNFTPLIT